ncbi:MAG: hypothetical protein ACLUI3_15250 [Christensenellales bacterium]
MLQDRYAHTALKRRASPAVRDLFEQICRRNSYWKYPLVSLLFAVATPLCHSLRPCRSSAAGARACSPAALARWASG